MPSTETSVRTVILGILLGLAATLLIYGHALGLGFSLYGFVLIGALVVYALIQKIRPAYRNLFILVPVLFFVTMLTIRSDETLTFLNLGAATASALLLIYFFTSGNIAQQAIVDYPAKILVSGVAVGVQPASELNQARKWVSTHRSGWHYVAPIMRGAIIAVPVVAVFVILFSSADEVFARLVSRIASALIPANLDELGREFIFTAAFAWMATGGLAFALLDRKAKRAPNDRSGPQVGNLETPDAQAAPAPFFSLGFTETIMVLGSVCVVFVAFVAVQFVYLFGGVRNIANFSYAEYARRGFVELIVVAVLTLGLALLLNVLAIRRTRRQTNIFRGLSTGLILLTAIILVSAFQRLRLYELTYGFTSLRLLIYVFIVWLGVLFAGFTLSLFWTPATINVFPLTALIAVLGFVATLDILNPDAFVAWQNLNRGDIDPIYLSTLSEEAVPVLISLVDAPEPGVRAIITDALTAEQRNLEWYREHADWRDFNLARSNAIALLDGIQQGKLNVSSRLYPTPGLSLDSIQALLRKGMTTREVVRELGRPIYQLGAESVGNDGRQTSNQKFVYAYVLGDMRSIRLRFDTAQGLEDACVLNLVDSCIESITLNQ